ncbi:Thioesterase [Actinobacteria bacterium OK074]|nr:Thioesterase [Actinobacteria bacterium OK074]
MNVPAVSWLRRYQPSSVAEFRLVCFPHAGGSASFYTSWARRLAPHIDVLAVQYPGRQDRFAETPVVELMDMVAPVAQELAEWNDLPLALFGHSMGAVVAYEVARRLERDAADGTGSPSPAWCFASGRVAPHRGRSFGAHLLDDDRLIARLRGLEAMDERLLADDELLRLVLPVVRGDCTAIETYQYEPGAGLGCPLTVLMGDADPRVPAEDAAAWREHAAGEYELRVFPGRHFFLLEHQTEIFRLIQNRLDSIRPPTLTL